MVNKDINLAKYNSIRPPYEKKQPANSHKFSIKAQYTLYPQIAHAQLTNLTHSTSSPNHSIPLRKTENPNDFSHGTRLDDPQKSKFPDLFRVAL